MPLPSTAPGDGAEGDDAVVEEDGRPLPPYEVRGGSIFNMYRSWLVDDSSSF